jgi:MSHA biogenesis protein MshJ
MKRRWQQFAARVDALSLRERALVFAALAGLIVFAAYLGGVGPLLQKQVVLGAQLAQQQNNLTGMDAEIAQKLHAYEVDPDAESRARLAAVKAESAQLGESLRAMQKGLVAPERMAPLIDAILRANGRLKLVSMRTLPVSSLNEAPPGEGATLEKAEAKPAAKTETAAKLEEIRRKVAESVAKAAAAGAPTGPAVAPKPGSLLYRHGVEITVRGNYLDMIDYMTALESLPTQLFWGGAKLEVEDYPTARLTLTMYTLSLDQKWLKL